MRFNLTAAEFAVLFAMSDLYGGARFASLITHTVAPDRYTLDNVRNAYLNATQIHDQRYLFPFVSSMMPEAARRLSPDDVQVSAGKLVECGLLVADGDGFCWSEPGLFLAESLHRRSCMLSMDVVGADEQGLLGGRCAMFVRSDQPLWYFGLGRSAATQVVTAGVTREMAGALIDEMLKPTGIPRLPSDLEAFQATETDRPEAPAPLAPMGPSFCPQCGKSVSPGAKFCKGCGTRLSQAATPS